MKTKILMALLAGATLLAACKGSGSASSADSVNVDSGQRTPVKLVKTAEMRFKVKDVRKVAEQISAWTALSGGTVVHHNMQSNTVNKQDITLANDSIKRLTVFNIQAEMVIKIPNEVVEPIMDSLNRLGVFVDDRKMDVEDRTIDYFAEKLKAKNREASVALRTQIKLTQKGADSLLQLKDDVVDRKVSNMRTDDAAKFSVINLSLYQNNTVTSELLANDDLGTYNSSIGVRLGLALSRGWYYFSEMIIVALHLWAFLLTGAVVWLGVYLYKRKKRSIPQPGA